MSRLPSTVRSAIWGAGAYLFGYLVTYLWKGQYDPGWAAQTVVRFKHGGVGRTLVSETTLSNLLGDGGVTATTWAGWLFYNAQFVPLNTGSFPFSRADVPNLIMTADSAAVNLLFLVAPLTLVVTGALAARNLPANETSILPFGIRLNERTVRGMSVAFGYLPLSLLGTVYFKATPVDSRVDALAPDFIISLALMGFVLPVVFGAAGGWLSSKWLS